MKEIYMDAFSEVNEILSIMPSNLANKIPLKLKQLINKYKNDNYRPQIKEPIENYELMDESKIILSLIYRDFICSNEEKEKLKIRDSQKLKEEEQELREKYNPDNIFKERRQRKIDNDIEYNQETSLIVKEEKWYKRLYNFFRSIFRRS